MGKTATVLILGGGTGGVVAANVLGKALSKRHRIILIDRSDRHYFKPSYPFVLVNLRRLPQISRTCHLQKEVTLLQAGWSGARAAPCGDNAGPWATITGHRLGAGAPGDCPGLEAGAYSHIFPNKLKLCGGRSRLKKGKLCSSSPAFPIPA